MDFIKDLSARHERLKKRIHSFRIPLGPFGQRVMGVVYFSIPLILGYYIMEATTNQSKKNNNLDSLKRDPNKAMDKEVQQQNHALQLLLDHHKKSKENSKNQ